MSKYLALSVCLLFAVSARTQDEFIKDFSQAQVEKFIKEVIKVEPISKKIGKDLLYYNTPIYQYDIKFRTTPGQRGLFFSYDFGSLRTTPEKMNQWNFEMRHTHCSIHPKSGNISLQASMNTESGITWKQLTNFYQQIQREREVFWKYILAK